MRVSLRHQTLKHNPEEETVDINDRAWADDTDREWDDVYNSDREWASS